MRSSQNRIGLFPLVPLNRSVLKSQRVFNQAVHDGVPQTGLQLLRSKRVPLKLWIKLQTWKGEVKLSAPRGRPLKNSMIQDANTAIGCSQDGVAFQKGGFGGCSPAPKKTEQGFIRMFPGTQKTERGYIRMFHGTKHRNEGTFAKTALLRNCPFVSSQHQIANASNLQIETIRRALHPGTKTRLKWAVRLFP